MAKARRQLYPGAVDSRAHAQRCRARAENSTAMAPEHGDDTGAKLGVDRADVEGDGAQNRVENGRSNHSGTMCDGVLRGRQGCSFVGMTR